MGLSSIDPPKSGLAAQVLRGLCLCALAAFAFQARAQAIPAPQGKYVSDYANVLSLEDQRAIERELSNVEEQTGIEITVATIDQISDLDASNPPIESFAKTWFNTWGVGKRSSNDGILVLLSVKDRKCRIQTGAGYTSDLDGRMSRIMDERMVPQFKQGNYSSGLLLGVYGITGEVTRPVTWTYKNRWPLGIIAVAVAQILVGLVLRAMGNPYWSGVMIFGVVFLFFGILMLMWTGRDQSSSTFGGGFSSGGGATGSW